MEPQVTDDAITDALSGALGLETADPAAPEEAVTDDTLVHEDGTPLTEEELEAVGDEDGLAYDDLPTNIKDRAEKLGVDPSMFYDADVTLSDGTVMSIGEMKDQIQSGGAVNASVQQQQQQLMQQRQQFEARQAIDAQLGAPMRNLEEQYKKIEAEYGETNWQGLVEEYGADKVELARVKMQQQYTQLKSQAAEMKARYDGAIANYSGNIANAEITAILQKHPDWQDMTVARTEMGKIHQSLASTGITMDEIVSEVTGTGGAVKLALLELAVLGANAGNIDNKRVRKAVKTLKTGRTITAAQQKRMQTAKAMKAAQGGTRQEKLAASVALIQQAGGI